MTDHTGERQPTSLRRQQLIIAVTIPFAVITPPVAGLMLATMVLLRWDLRREPIWWVLILAGWFLPWVYILIAIVFLSKGGTTPRMHEQETFR